MIPNFLVVGAAKAGTTWLYSCLEEHPEVFVPKSKEIHFFSYPRRYQKGIEWYNSFFLDRTTEKAVGEISPSYLPSLEAPARIQAYNPSMRLVFVLRNPVERAYSHYCMAMRTGKSSLDVDSGLTFDGSYVTWGLYYDQIERFMNYFPQEQLKFFLFEDIKNDPEKLLRDLYSYLEVDCAFQPSLMFKPKNTKQALPKYPKLYKYLRGVYGKIISSSDYGRDFMEYLRLKGYLNSFHKFNKGSEFPTLSKEKKTSLVQFYRQDITALSNLLQRDLSHWLVP